MTCASNVAAIQPPTYQSLLPPFPRRRHARNVAPKMKGVGVAGRRERRGITKRGLVRVRRRFLARPRAPILSPNLSFISPSFSSPPSSLVSPFFILLLRYQRLVFRTFNVVQFFLSFLLEIVLSKTIVPRFVRANCCQIIDVGKNGEERRLASFFARWDATLAGQFEKQTEGNA